MSLLLRTEFFNAPNLDTFHTGISAGLNLKTDNFAGLIRCALINMCLYEYMTLEFREANFKDGQDS
jgi:hypothetical protein